MAQPATIQCPECGCRVNAGQKHCWMCSRPVEWEDDAIKGSTENNVTVGAAHQRRTRFWHKLWNIVGLVAVAIAGVQAVVSAFYVTFFVTCIAEVQVHGINRVDEGFMWLTSIGAAFVVFVGFVMLLVSMGRRAFRKTPL